VNTYLWRLLGVFGFDQANASSHGCERADEVGRTAFEDLDADISKRGDNS